MKVTVRLSTENSFSVTVPDNANVEDLNNSITVACPEGLTIPLKFKLILNGERLTPNYKSLSDFNVESEVDKEVSANDIIVILMLIDDDSDVITKDLLNTSGSVTTSSNVAGTQKIKKKSSKKKCSFKSCNSLPLRMVGDCHHCNGKFCAKHRLLEDHYCSGLQYCKDNAHEQNASKLESERTISSKV